MIIGLKLKILICTNQYSVLGRTFGCSVLLCCGRLAQLLDQGKTGADGHFFRLGPKRVIGSIMQSNFIYTPAYRYV